MSRQSAFGRHQQQQRGRLVGDERADRGGGKGRETEPDRLNQTRRARSEDQRSHQRCLADTAIVARGPGNALTPSGSRISRSIHSDNRSRGGAGSTLAACERDLLNRHQLPSSPARRGPRGRSQRHPAWSNEVAVPAHRAGDRQHPARAVRSMPAHVASTSWRPTSRRATWRSLELQRRPVP